MSLSRPGPKSGLFETFLMLTAALVLLSSAGAMERPGKRKFLLVKLADSEDEDVARQGDRRRPVIERDESREEPAYTMESGSHEEATGHARKHRDVPYKSRGK